MCLTNVQLAAETCDFFYDLMHAELLVGWLSTVLLVEEVELDSVWPRRNISPERPSDDLQLKFGTSKAKELWQKKLD